MTTQEWLVLAGSLAAGAAVTLVLLVAALRLGRRGSPGMADLDAMRRLTLRLRRLDRIARQTERRLDDHVGELRRLLSQADAKAAARGAGDGTSAPSKPAHSDGPAFPTSPDAGPDVLPGILEKQRDLIFRLRLQGLEPMDIARRLRLPIGEVELTLRLRDEEAGTYQADSPAHAAPADPRDRAEAGS